VHPQGNRFSSQTWTIIYVDDDDDDNNTYNQQLTQKQAMFNEDQLIALSHRNQGFLYFESTNDK
jgi:hypothetical protein